MQYEWIKAERLPPVDCPLVINVNGAHLHATRISYLQEKNGQMDYRLASGVVIRGRYPWSYP